MPASIPNLDFKSDSLIPPSASRVDKGEITTPLLVSVEALSANLKSVVTVAPVVTSVVAEVVDAMMSPPPAMYPLRVKPPSESVSA